MLPTTLCRKALQSVCKSRSRISCRPPSRVVQAYPCRPLWPHRIQKICKPGAGRRVRCINCATVQTVIVSSIARPRQSRPSDGGLCDGGGGCTACGRNEVKECACTCIFSRRTVRDGRQRLRVARSDESDGPGSFGASANGPGFTPPAVAGVAEPNGLGLRVTIPRARHHERLAGGTRDRVRRERCDDAIEAQGCCGLVVRWSVLRWPVSIF